MIYDLQNIYKKKGKQVSQRQATKIIVDLIKYKNIPLVEVKDGFIWE